MSISFSGKMSDVEMNLATAGFSTSLWVPEFGWDESEAEASEEIHPPQMLAALQCFLAFFVKPVQRYWVHLAAEMQAGKTGVVNALVRLVLSNASLLGIRPTRIFVLTGMGDNAWKKQTRKRLPRDLRANVHHSGGLAKVSKTLRGMCVTAELSNVLIIIDESHFAAGVNNRPNMIYDEVKRLCPQEKWQDNNIRFLTISATDPARVLMVKDVAEAQVVRLQTTEKYQSVASLNTAKRIRFAEKFGHLDSDEAIAEIKRCVSEELSDTPRYHIVRARTRGGKQEEAMEKLRKAFPSAVVRKFDSEEKLSAKEENESSDLSDMDDINEILNTPPEVETFIVLKNMFYAGKTFNDEYVGLLYDRLGNKDDTNLQSLLGRACGYGKSSRTIIYTSKKTVENYIGFWHELCSDPRWTPTLEGIPVSHVDKKMTGVRVQEVAGVVNVTVNRTITGPSGGGSGGFIPQKSTHENCVVAVEEFPSMDALNKRWSEITGKNEKCRTPNRNTTGEYVCSIGKKSVKQTASEIRAFAKGGTKGWGSGITNAAIGDPVQRVYVGYEDAAPVFFLRWTVKK
jgi:hypothetical protein